MRAPGDSLPAGLRAAMVLGAALWLGGLSGLPAAAQSGGGGGSPVLTLDQEQLFQSTLFGQRMQRELAEARRGLIAENARKQEELEAEEARLTEQRTEMEPGAFRELADAFDDRVETIRAEQEAKSRALQRRQERAQQVFFRAIAPVVREVVQARGAVAILDQRAIIIASGDIDVTDEVRARVDEILGDGGSIGEPGEGEDDDAPLDPEAEQDDDAAAPVPAPIPGAE